MNPASSVTLDITTILSLQVRSNEIYTFDNIKFSLYFIYNIINAGVNLTGIGQYLCLQNMLKAHALAYHIYDEEFRYRQQGKVGIVIQCITPYSNDSTDNRFADIAFEFECGWQANPIFSKTGDYPAVMKKMIAQRSKLQGYYSSRLPTLSKYWIEFIRYI